jgi:hypothetical protein
MLAYSVFSLRLSEDVPSQSDSVHLISLYLTVCMFFSLSAMTWFAIVNKLRERKRLPYWLRWLALDYISWIVCAPSMHRKAVHAVKQGQLKTSPVTPSTPVEIPLQPTIATTNQMEYSNSYYYDRESLTTGISATFPLLSSKSSQPHSLSEHPINTLTTRPNQFHALSTNETAISRRNSPSTVWIRRRLTKIPSLSSLSNGPFNKKTNQTSKTSTQSHSIKLSNDHSARKNKESLYAIHIYNRLVFLMFLITVIVINIYTWFFYSRTVKTRLLDDRTPWSCFDESRLEIINCSDRS